MPGNVNKQSADTWRIRYELPRDPVTGKRRQGSETFKGVKEDAEKRLREILSDLDKGVFVEPAKVTLEEYLRQWLDIHKPNLRDKNAHVMPNMQREAAEKFEALFR